MKKKKQTAAEKMEELRKWLTPARQKQIIRDMIKWKEEKDRERTLR